MSCHNIGAGLNEVVRMTISLFDKEQISRESAKKIIATCRVAVNWCDGNEGEATEYISNCRCGNCLKLVPKGEKLYSTWDLPRDFRMEKDIDEGRLRIAYDGLCEECFDDVINPFCDEEYDTEKLKKYIEDNTDVDCYTSEGEHPKSNNGYRWVRGTDWFD